MSTELRITLSAEAQALIARAPAWPVEILRGLARAHDLQNELTIGYAQQYKLSQRSRTTLGVVTNRLRSSLTRDNASIVASSVDSSIGTNVSYAGVHEFGFIGTVQVKSHTRRVKSRDIPAIGKSGQPLKNKIVASGVTTVRAHAMRMNMPERSYIRSSIHAREGEYSAAFSAAVVGAIDGKGGQT